MSFLFKPGAGGGGVTGTAVDPLGPGGVLIEIPTEVVQVPGAPLPAGHVLQADGLGGFIMGPQSGTGLPDNRFGIQFHHSGGVPSGGTRYLQYGQNVISSSTGFRMSAAARLRGITINVETTSANAYNIEVLQDPVGRLGAPVVLATLALPATSVFAINRTFAVAVATTDELGVRVVRTSGSGAGLGQIAVMTEWSIP